jgi:hypothetical protein
VTRLRLDGSFQELSLGLGGAGVGFAGGGAASFVGMGIGKSASGTTAGSSGGALSPAMIGARNGEGHVTHSAGHGCQQVLW